ncbi:MAG TPA: caspase family protein, partial [Polyangia bacterium]|nr:caspase family protein [Polyangia bacterium]
MIAPLTVWPALLLAARIAIVSSSNQADGQATLRYADRDGERVGAVLTELGSVAPEDVWRLPNTTVPALRSALERAEERAAREPGSTIILYYSGHADAEGLLLGDQRFSYRELRERLARSHAQVRVAVLDACNAGGATRPKGGHQSAGPVFTPVEPMRVDGAAILAATGAEELAQESSDVEGSYFTHHLISGLRGAGDRDGNGVITLGEAYAYVYARTVAATAPSLWGPQHPSYDYRLSGTGDLALTTLARGRQGLTFPSAPAGTFTVVDGARDVVAEVRADARRSQRLALAPGRYHVTYRAAGRLSATDVRLMAGADTIVSR